MKLLQRGWSRRQAHMGCSSPLLAIGLPLGMPTPEFHSAGCGAFLFPFTLKDSPDGAEQDDTSQLPKMSRCCFSGEWGLLTFLRGNMSRCAPGVMGLACQCHGLGCVPEHGTSQKPSWCHQPTVDVISPSLSFSALYHSSLWGSGCLLS